jgi:hypothetical protein
MGLTDNEITFENCETPEKLEKLRAFAATFDPPHFIEDTKHRIIIFKRRGEWIGYAEIVNTPIVFTAWNKNRCKPRDIVETMKAFVGWARIEHGEGFTAVPLDTRTFPEKIMNKLGFYRLKTELYSVNNK